VRENIQARGRHDANMCFIALEIGGQDLDKDFGVPHFELSHSFGQVVAAPVLQIWGDGEATVG